jgi:plastocyanin domain-containing protein
MPLDKLLVTIIDIWAIGFVYWFFLMKEDKPVQVTDSIDILVDGGYSPSTIVVKKGQRIKLNFLRKDPSSCLEEVVLGEFKTRKYLPLHKRVTIEIKPQEEGEFPFACGMNMYHGKIIIK